MPSHQPITPGAQRSLDRAARLAVADGATTIETRHMLWALWLEEGNAAALLDSLGVRKEHIQLEDLVAADLLTVHVGDMAEEILYEARQFARRFSGQSTELTSEHLLLALTTTDQVRLEGLGVTVEQIVSIAFPQPDTSALPVAPEFRIGDDERVDERTEGSRPEVSRRTRPVNPAVFNEHSQVLRAIDAAANRTREGLRVVEDYTRFVLDDRFLTEELKRCRHELASVLEQVSNDSLIRCRDTRGDVGTSVTTSREYQRASMQGVVLANMKRVQEGLRTLEEFLKVGETDSVCSANTESIRYPAVTQSKKQSRRPSGPTIRSLVASLYLLVTESLCRLPWKTSCDACVRRRCHCRATAGEATGG